MNDGTRINQDTHEFSRGGINQDTHEFSRGMNRDTHGSGVNQGMNRDTHGSGVNQGVNQDTHGFTRLERRLLNDFQQEMPMSATPYADMAAQLGVSESAVLQSLEKLQQCGAISRIGPVFKPNRIGVSTLAAMSVPEDELECTARIISAFPEVNHNYEREHAYNLWFVVTASSEEHLEIVLHEIEMHAQYPLMSLPMLEDYFIDLGFRLSWE